MTDFAPNINVRKIHLKVEVLPPQGVPNGRIAAYALNVHPDITFEQIWSSVEDLYVTTRLASYNPDWATRPWYFKTIQDDYADVIRTDTVGDAFAGVPRRERILQVVQIQFDREGSVPPDCPIRPPLAPAAIAWGDIEIEELRKIKDDGPDEEAEASNIVDQTFGSPELGTRSRASSPHPDHFQVSNTPHANEDEVDMNVVDPNEDEMDITVADPIEDDDETSPLRLTGGATWLGSPVQQQPSWPPSSPDAVRSALSNSLSHADKATLRSQNLTKKWTSEDKTLLITALAEEVKVADIHFRYLPHRSLESIRKQAVRFRKTKAHEIAVKRREINSQALRASANRKESRAIPIAQREAPSSAQHAPTPVYPMFDSPQASKVSQDTQGLPVLKATPATQTTQTAMYTVPESPQASPEPTPHAQETQTVTPQRPTRAAKTDVQNKSTRSAGPFRRASITSSQPQDNATTTTPSSSQHSGPRLSKVASWTEEHDKIFEQAIRNNKDWRTLHSRHFPTMAQEVVMARYADIRVYVEEKDDADYRIRKVQELEKQGEPSSTDKEPFNEWENDFLLAARLEGSEIKRLAKSHFPLRTADVVAKHAASLHQNAQRAAKKWLKSQSGSKSSNDSSTPATNDLLDAMNPAKRLRIEAKRMQVRRESKQIAADRTLEHESSVKRAEDKARTIGVQARLRKSVAMHALLEEEDRKAKKIKNLRAAEDYHNAEAHNGAYAAWEKQASIDKTQGNPIQPEPERPKGSSIGVEIAITKPNQGRSAPGVHTATANPASERPLDRVVTSDTIADAHKDAIPTRKRRKSLLEVRIDLSKKQKLDNNATSTGVNPASQKPDLKGKSPASKTKLTLQQPKLATIKVQGSDFPEKSQPLNSITGSKANIVSQFLKPESVVSTPKRKAREAAASDPNVMQTRADQAPTAAHLLASCSKTNRGSNTSSGSGASVPVPDDDESFSDPDLDDEALSELIERSSDAFPSSPPHAEVTTPPAGLAHSFPKVHCGKDTEEMDFVVTGSRNFRRGIIEIGDADEDAVVITGGRTLQSQTKAIAVDQASDLHREAPTPTPTPTPGHNWGTCKIGVTGPDLEEVLAGHEGARSLAREASAACSPVKKARDTKRPSERTKKLQQQYEELKKAPSQAEKVLDDIRSAHHKDIGPKPQVPSPSRTMEVDEFEHESQSAQSLSANDTRASAAAVVDDDGASVEEIDRNCFYTWVSGEDSDWDDDYVYGQDSYAKGDRRRDSLPHATELSPRSSLDGDMPDAQRTPVMPQSAYSKHEPATQDLRPPFPSSGQPRVFTPTQSELDKDEASQREEERMARSAAEQLQMEGRNHAEVHQSPQPEIGRKRQFRNRTRNNRHKKKQRLDSGADTNSERSSEHDARHDAKLPSAAMPAASKKTKQAQPIPQGRNNATQPAKPRLSPGGKGTKTSVKSKKRKSTHSANGSVDVFSVKKGKTKGSKKRSSTTVKK